MLSTSPKRTGSAPIVKDHRDRGTRRLRAARGGDVSRGGNGHDAHRHELGRQGRQGLILSARPAFFDADRLSLDETSLRQPFAEGVSIEAIDVGRSGVQEAHERHALLSTHHARTHDARAADKRSELSPPHAVRPVHCLCAILSARCVVGDSPLPIAMREMSDRAPDTHQRATAPGARRCCFLHACHLPDDLHPQRDNELGDSELSASHNEYIWPGGCWRRRGRWCWCRRSRCRCERRRECRRCQRRCQCRSRRWSRRCQCGWQCRRKCRWVKRRRQCWSQRG
jgi:hypothetical protein